MTKVEYDKIMRKMRMGDELDGVTEGPIVLTDAQKLQALANLEDTEANALTGKLGYKVLQTNRTFAEQVTDENTVYEIRDVFDLMGSVESPVVVSLPANTTLKFNGGLIKNCTISADSLNIEAGLEKVFDGVSFTGNCANNEFKAEWFVDQYYNQLVISSPALDASLQFNSLFSCGVRKVSFNDPNRFYNINNTISISGHVDICTKFKNYQDSGLYKGRYGCIYSLQNITLINYFYSDADSGTLNINGLNLMNLFNSNDENYIETASIPLFYLHNQTPLWGVVLDVNITARGSSISPSVLGITTATVDKKSFYNFTGLKILAEYDFISMVKIRGLIQKTHYGIVTSIDKSHVVSNWFTDVTLTADTRCDIGGLFDDDGPDYIYGSHQSSKLFDSENRESYFRANECRFRGYVWDLYTSQNGIYAPYYPYLESGFKLKSIEKTVEHGTCVTNFNENGYVNNIIKPSFLGVNALNRAIDNSSCPNFLKDGNNSTFSFKASVFDGNDWGEEVDAIDGMSAYYELYYKHNLFGESAVPSSCVFANARMSNIAYYHAVVAARIRFKINFRALYTAAASLHWLFIYAVSNTAKSMTVKIGQKTYDLSPAAMQSYGTRSQFFLDYNTEVEIIFENTITANSNYRLPNIFLPQQYHSYPALSNSRLENNVPSTITSSQSTELIFNSTFAELCRFNNGKYTFLDGYTCARRKGSSSQRPSNLTANDNGFQYYDITLAKTISWNGSSWVNVDGSELITRTITNNLTNVSNSNAAASIENNSTYMAVLTPDNNYSINHVTITMDGVDITSFVYNDTNRVIYIPAVTGDLVINAQAVIV